MNTLWNKLLCVILSLTLLINLLPVSALALDTPVEQQSTPQHWEEDFLVETTENATQPLVTESIEESQAVIVREDVSVREEFVKHFEMSDGSYIATVYNEPVHQLVDGTWIEVDNSLTLSSAKGMAHYKTVNGLTDVSFAQNFGDKLVTMEQDDHFITWGVEATIDTLETMTVASAQFTDNLREPAQAEILPLDLSAVAAEKQKLFATKATSTIRYADALANGVDLEYTVLPSRIKENIILECPQSISAYVVTVNASDLSARLLDNREVEFYTEDGETVFTMWAPYMYDSASELSEDIAVELTAHGNGQYAITLTPNTTWLNSPDRVYPVVIDPMVSSSRVKSNIIDNYVLQGSGVQNKNLDRLYFGKKSGSIARTYIRYQELPYIPAVATITTATSIVYITSGTTTTNLINAYKVTEGQWQSGEISWENKPAATTAIAMNITPGYQDGKLCYAFACTDAVESWYDGSERGTNANYGIMLRYSNEAINDYNAVYSADYSDEIKRPNLVIRYTLPANVPEIVWPAPGYYTINSKWGYRGDPFNKMHRGIDIDMDHKNVVAAISGSVRFFDDDSAGNALVITKTNSSFQARYYHLKNDGYLVDEFSSVQVGDIIAISGNTGESTGAHLHFQLQWGNDKEKSYNPLEYYHRDDQRSTWTNPNPMFYERNGIFVPNLDFDDTYVASNYNSTSTSWAKKGG